MFFLDCNHGFSLCEFKPATVGERNAAQRKKNWLVGQLARYILGLILSFVLIYVLLIDQSITGFLNTFGFIIAINLMVSGLIQLPTNEKKQKESTKTKIKKNHSSHLCSQVLVCCYLWG